MANKAVFIDKDGTLIPDIPFNADPLLVTLNAHAGPLLRSLKDAGYLLLVISNQSGVAKGNFELSDLDAVNSKINLLLEAFATGIDAFYYCPHLPDAKLPQFSVECNCRKPKPGLLLQAASDYQVDLRQSWMIGDILNDCEAGNRAGCTTILLDNGNETEWILTDERQPDYKVSDLSEIESIILPNSVIKPRFNASQTI